MTMLCKYVYDIDISRSYFNTSFNIVYDNGQCYDQTLIYFQRFRATMVHTQLYYTAVVT